MFIKQELPKIDVGLNVISIKCIYCVSKISKMSFCDHIGSRNDNDIENVSVNSKWYLLLFEKNTR